MSQKQRLLISCKRATYKFVLSPLGFHVSPGFQGLSQRDSSSSIFINHWAWLTQAERQWMRVEARALRWPVASLSKDVTRTGLCLRAKLLQSSLTLCNPLDRKPGRLLCRGILQARILEWIAIPSSRASSQPRGQAHTPSVSCIGRQVLYH